MDGLDDHNEAETAQARAGGRKVREGERMLADGGDPVKVPRHLEFTEWTWHRWRRAYAGMSALDARRLKALEARLKKLLTEAELDRAMLKELAEGNGDSVTRTAAGSR